MYTVVAFTAHYQPCAKASDTRDPPVARHQCQLPIPEIVLNEGCPFQSESNYRRAMPKAPCDQLRIVGVHVAALCLHDTSRIHLQRCTVLYS